MSKLSSHCPLAKSQVKYRYSRSIGFIEGASLRELVTQMLDGDVAGSLETLDRRLESEPPLRLHEEIYPVAQAALNPPFINPHMPKMHRICGGFYHSLGVEDAGRLIHVEVNEYARRPKMAVVRRPRRSLRKAGGLTEAIRGGDVEGTAAAMDAINRLEGSDALAAMLLRLGGGYLGKSLGHSVSCTSFILQELRDRGPDGCWPSLSVLAKYFCEGGYAEEDETSPVSNRGKAVEGNILRAVSGTGIASLHDNLTIYAVEKIRPHIDDATYSRVVSSWIGYLGDKGDEPFRLTQGVGGSMLGFEEFERLLQAGEVEKLVQRASPMLASEDGPDIIGVYTLRVVVRNMGGRVDPHVLTGLGSLLWVIGRGWDSPEVKPTALYQYLNYSFGSIKR